MSYREEQRKKAVEQRDKLFNDNGGGVFRGEKREFVLNSSKLNLWSGIRLDAIDYFEKNNISWWMGQEPSGHLLSSQIACLNHLYYIRQREDLATAILQNIDNTITKAIKLDDGYVEFEVIGSKNYLGEKSHQRGSNATSIDAVMLGEKNDGNKILVVIEWKYTENYEYKSLYCSTRSNIYDPFLDSKNSPFKIENIEGLYYEPFYQLMRQTLLAEEMVKANEYNANDYIHIHVIPKENVQLMNKITSPLLKGDTITQAWKNVLKKPEKYTTMTPQDFLYPTINCPDTKSFINYIKTRYW